jgi:molybdopterin-guanine dinucleotide biosynthesis protein A
MTTPNLETIHFDAIILAGGRGSRMGGVDKGLLKFQDKLLIEHIIPKLIHITQKLIISCNQNFETYAHYGQVVADELPGFCGPLAGISSGLTQTTSEYALVLAVDTPFITTNEIQQLTNAMTDDVDICVAFDGEKLHPTTLLLRTHLKKDIDDFLLGGERKLGAWIQKNVYKKVMLTPKSLTNLNYPMDLL